MFEVHTVIIWTLDFTCGVLTYIYLQRAVCVCVLLSFMKLFFLLMKMPLPSSLIYTANNLGSQNTSFHKQPTCESTKYHNHSPPHKILASEIQVFSLYIYLHIYIYLDFLFTRNTQRCLQIAWVLRFNSFSVVAFGMWSV